MRTYCGAFGHKGRAAAIARLEQSMVDRSSVVVRHLGGTRAGEMSGHRVLGRPEVTPKRIVAAIAKRTGEAVAGCRVVAAQDTTEINFAGRTRTQLGPAGKNGDRPGFFIHAMVAVDADSQAMLGLVDAQIWTRDASPITARRKRIVADKESSRWLAAAEIASTRLASASQIIVVGDRESDIYALFARRPANVCLIVRAAQNRALATGGLLFDAARNWPLLCRRTVHVPPRRVGDPGRQAQVEVRAGTVTLRHPSGMRCEGDKPTVKLALVEAEERFAPSGVEPLHWRLLTTLPVADVLAASDVIGCYRLRWRAEQTFRMTKSDGLRLEETQTYDKRRLFNLAVLAVSAAVRIIQLVDARDGSARPAEDVADKAQIAAAYAICPKLEGKTERQKNHHPTGSLAWLSWVVARLGGWNCYYKPPGPKTMRRGWDRLAAIAEGYALVSPELWNV